MCLAAEELAGAWAADEFSGIDDGAAARENFSWRSFDLNALEHGVVDAHVVCLGADDLLVVRVEDHDVGVGADGDGSFAWIEAEELSGRCRDEFDEAVGGEAVAVDAAGVDEAEAVLDARAAVGDFREVVPA